MTCADEMQKAASEFIAIRDDLNRLVKKYSDKRPAISQVKIASVIMGVPGWHVSEPDATHSQIAHRIAREVIEAITN